MIPEERKLLLAIAWTQMHLLNDLVARGLPKGEGPGVLKAMADLGIAIQRVDALPKS